MDCFKILAMTPVLDLRGNLLKGVGVTVNGESVQFNLLDEAEMSSSSFVYLFVYGGRRFVVKVCNYNYFNNIVKPVYREALVGLENEFDRYLELSKFRGDQRSQFILFPVQFEEAVGNRPLHLIYEYLPGGDLYYFFQKNFSGDANRKALFPVSRVVLEQVANSISFLHDHNVAHLDIKSENVLIERGDVNDPSSIRVRLIDGECCLTLEKHEFVQREKLFGTVEYLSSETVKDQYCSFGNDSYALGVFGFEMYFFPGFPLDKDGKYTSSYVVEAAVEGERVRCDGDAERQNYLMCILRLTNCDFHLRATVEEGLLILMGKLQ